MTTVCISNSLDTTHFQKTLKFSRTSRLIKTDEFSSVFNFRKRLSGYFLAIHYQYNGYTYPRLGLIVAKKVAKSSVDRNYMRRVLRELFRHHQHHYGQIKGQLKRVNTSQQAMMPVADDITTEMPDCQHVDLVIRTQRLFTSNDYAAVKLEFIQLLAKLPRPILANTVSDTLAVQP